MADFSKQYCERYDPEMIWDFDIEEIFDEMPDSSYKAIICEGFGFNGLVKNKHGNRFCVFGDWHEVPYEEVDLETYKLYNE
jgi:hypothetical protein